MERHFRCLGFSDELDQNAVFQKGSDADTADFVAEILGAAIDFDVVRGVAGEIAFFGLLKQNVVLRADLGGQEGGMERGGSLAGEGGAALLFRFFNLTWHGRGGRALAAGVGEDVNGG